ncbi:MAG: methyltransferase domain-containing protein [Acidimicrobiales bacterium]
MKGPGVPPYGLDVGCGPAKKEEVGMDRVGWEGVDVVHDVVNVPWPFEDERFARVQCHHVLEHLPFPQNGDVDPVVRVLNEAHRVLRPGGVLIVSVPHCRSRGAWGNIRHTRAFHPDAFRFMWDPLMHGDMEIERWKFLRIQVTREFPGWWHLRGISNTAYEAACRMKLGRPQNIIVRASKPFLKVPPGEHGGPFR